MAHRGYWNCEAGGRARNSLAAFKAAHEAGFWGTEFDVCMTADGEMIVFHDETLNGKRIDHTDWAEIAGHRLENGETIPRLDEFLAYASRQKNFPMLVFELKGHITEELQDRAVALAVGKLKRHGMFDPSKVMFISFYLRQCRLLAEAAPGFTVQYLGKNVTTDDLLDNRINGIDTYYKSLLEDPEWLRLARNHGFSVNTWTVDAANDMRRVLALHIDQLTTDEPDLARRVLAEEGIRELVRNGEMKPAKTKKAKKLKKQLTAGDYVLCYGEILRQEMGKGFRHLYGPQRQGALAFRRFSFPANQGFRGGCSIRSRTQGPRRQRASGGDAIRLDETHRLLLRTGAVSRRDRAGRGRGRGENRRPRI